MAETTPERRYGLTDGDAESTGIPKEVTEPASESETALDEGMASEVEDEEVLRWGRSVKPASRFDPLVMDAATETVVTRINGAPNNRLPENQTVEIGIPGSSELGDYGSDAKVGEGRRRGEVSVSRASKISLGGHWKRRVTFVVRTVQIWAFLVHVLLKLLRQKLVQKDEARMSARRRKLGKYLCKAFLKLGPTFIKIGQVRFLV